jgi:restriction system protein
MLKTAGLVTNSTRGVWALTDAQLNPSSIDPRAVRRKHRELSRRVTTPGSKSDGALSGALTYQQAAEDDWTARILEAVQNIRPEQFERLALRVLREAGFIDLTVTGRIGDGGIDGKGIIRVSGVVSFHVVFQCKRYAGSVSGEQIRAFRGAMEGRADRGVFITSGRYTAAAKAEATREGARPIDLLDGTDFASMLKQFGLGVKSRMVEAIDIDNEWFGRL